MADISYSRIEDIDTLPFLEGFAFRSAGIELDVKPFGISIIDMPPGSDYPEHDHSSEGPGNPPAHQLGQEEVYMALSGAAEVEVDGEGYPLEAGGSLIRVGPTARRKIVPGPEGVRLLALGGYPGRVYERVEIHGR